MDIHRLKDMTADEIGGCGFVRSHEDHMILALFAHMIWCRSHDPPSTDGGGCEKGPGEFPLAVASGNHPADNEDGAQGSPPHYPGV